MDFGEPVASITVTVGMMGEGEGQPFDETGRWTAYDAAGNRIAAGLLGPELSALGAGNKVANSYGTYPIPLGLDTVASRVVIEATGFGHGQGGPISASYGENNSDFNIVAIRYTRPGSSDPGPDPDPDPDPEPEPEPRRTLSAALAVLSGSTNAQPWDDGVTLAATASSGNAGIVSFGWEGLAVAGGRYDLQIDYDPVSRSSEQLQINFNGPVTEVSIDLSRMEGSEWESLAETGRWTALDAAGREVAAGLLDPGIGTKVGRQYRFAISTPTPLSRLVIAATAYGNGIGTERMDNNSDFNLSAVSYRRLME